ncbi:MAG: hypothetical protein Q9227_009433 [Pyrenula ochraceoflavens]
MVDDSTITVESAAASSPTNGNNADSGSPKEAGEEPRRNSISKSSPASSGHSPPKTDKPRPHKCTTCGRGFARLEHLKRHERSHTKEKPFECPECQRCFARRDLLLRHQQKLHSTTTPSSRPRSGRRESNAAATGRVRKNSVANAGTGSMRPRANTISHIDGATMDLIAAANANISRPFHSNHHHHSSYSSVAPPRPFPSHLQHMPPNGLTRLDTSNISNDMTGGLRTAPPFRSFNEAQGMDPFAFSNGNTIDPAQLHFGGESTGMNLDTPASPFYPMFANNFSQNPPMMEDDMGMDWINSFDNNMGSLPLNESAIETSSPSAIGNSPGDSADPMASESTRAMTNYMDHMAISASPLWPASMTSQAPMLNSPTGYELPPTTFPEVWAGPNETPQLSSALNFNQPTFSDDALSPTSGLPTMSPTMTMPTFQGPNFNLPMNGSGDTPTASSVSERSSLRHSSVTTASSDSITEATRQVLLRSLTQQSGFGQRKPSQPAVSSPLSATFASRSKALGALSLPATGDLQRYVSAYIQYFHPHLPFLHIPSLSFDSPEYTVPLGTSAVQAQFGSNGIAGGGGCLILAMAAIGALYEDDHTTSKDLFEAAKKMIQGYLEERRKANLNKAQCGPRGSAEPDNTPLWLVQAMLLNVIYGHNCGDKTSADIASTHCAALVSLARAAELARPYAHASTAAEHPQPDGTADLTTGDASNQASIESEEESEWLQWKIVEERKRTLYAVFILSSLLVSAYNHAPALTNSEIRLDLPCDEELWSAENARAWRELGGYPAVQSQSVTFAQALSHLLTASQRQLQQQMSAQGPSFVPGSVENMPGSDLRPSTFGCLILINALHNYIWETRQRHLGRQWTSKESDAMHAHIEPALKAWQAAWLTNKTHSIERPNPHGAGPLSADSMPLLDLAYVRLYVNLGRSKEAFWQRDWDAMAEELAHGSEFVQQAETSSQPDSPQNTTAGEATPADANVIPSVEGNPPDLSLVKTPTQEHPGPGYENTAQLQTGQVSRRERHLRKAAHYAADSLCYSDRMGLTFADYTSRELPLQCAMCAFDCAQVLAEWVTTVQERTGRYIGIIGKDDIDFTQVPGMLLLEDEDNRLLEKISEFLRNAEAKMAGSAEGQNVVLTGVGSEGGFGSKILRVTAHMLERSVVWPVTKLMARSLETQAAHIQERAESSVLASATSAQP